MLTITSRKAGLALAVLFTGLFGLALGSHAGTSTKTDKDEITADEIDENFHCPTGGKPLYWVRKKDGRVVPVCDFEGEGFTSYDEGLAIMEAEDLALYPGMPEE